MLLCGIVLVILGFESLSIKNVTIFLQMSQSKCFTRVLQEEAGGAGQIPVRS